MSAGLDKSTRLAAKRAEQATQAEQPVVLNPPFPGYAIPFPADFFGLPAQPQPAQP